MGRRVICLEGIECSGKTVLLEALRASGAGRGIQMQTVSEFPLGSPLAEPIGQALRSSIFIAEHFPGGPAAALEHMWEAELEKTRSRPATGLVVQDRGIPSVVIYQGYFIAGVELDAVGLVKAREAKMREMGEQLPDLYVVLDIPCAVLAARFERRNARTPSRTECEALQGMMELYRTLADSSPRYVRVRADDSEEAVLEAVQAELRTRGIEI